MSQIISSTLRRQSFKTFRPRYTDHYISLTGAYIVNDPQHPLYTAQIRIQNERKKEGLWWNATTGVGVSKSSCVRSWARRRLRNAIKEELKARGYDEKGKFVNVEALDTQPDLKKLLQQGKSLDLTGSIRLHVMPALIPAKYLDVKAEVTRVIEALMQDFKTRTPKTMVNSELPPRSRWNSTPRPGQQRIAIKKV